jgi:hypothetical protein
MEDQLETIELDMEESNELLFKVNVEGASSPARVRLVCEAEDISYMFDGHPTTESGVVQFLIPEMAGKLRSEGACEARVEVLIENRYFTPVRFGINFKKAVKVFAEAVQVPQARKQATQVQVSASQIIVNPRKKVVAEVVSEGPKPAAIAEPAEPARGSLRERWNKKNVAAEEPELDRLVSRNLRRNKKKKQR